MVVCAIYTSSEPNDKPQVRQAKMKASSKARKLLNLKASRRQLELLIAANFKYDDLHATFTYRQEERPDTWQEARKDVRKLVRAIRAHRKARGQELKYIYAIEGKHGDKHIHVHMVLNATGNDFEVLRSLWTKGDQVDFERIADREYWGLAEYLTKESLDGKPVGAQSWTPSKNLIRPTVETCYVENDETVTVPAGCRVIDKSEETVSEFGYYAYVKYMIVDPPARKVRPSRSVKRRKIE